MDLIESPTFTPPIILLQTVLEEVRHRSLPLYNRLKALVKADDKMIWVFYNEFRSSVWLSFLLCHCSILHRETAVVTEENETPNDRNDRGTAKVLTKPLDEFDRPKASGEVLSGIILTFRSPALPFVARHATFLRSSFSLMTLPTDKRPRLKTYPPFQVSHLCLLSISR